MHIKIKPKPLTPLVSLTEEFEAEAVFFSHLPHQFKYRICSEVFSRVFFSFRLAISSFLLNKPFPSDNLSLSDHDFEQLLSVMLAAALAV